jgi:hypothetical protein
MLRKTVTLFICAIMMATSTLAFAGGAPVAPCGPVCYPPKAPCGPGAAPGVASSSYWGDAPIPGLCGGVVALPFLVVGSLLGGNPSGPYGPPPVAGGYGYAPQGSPCAPAPCAPAPCPPRGYAAPCAPAPCAPAPCGPAQYAQAPCPPAPCGPYPQQPPCGPGAPNGGGIFSGLPCLELCSGLLGNITGGMNLLY